jgi:hypothetical protein
MKKTDSYMRGKAATTAIVLTALVLAALSTPLEAAPAKVKPLPPKGTWDGKNYSQWSAAWWQWALELPANQNPMFDQTGCINGANGQSGHVWYLTGVINTSGTAERSCTVPLGKALFFPVINTECSTVEPPPFHGDNEAELRDCAKGFMDATADLFCKIDGVQIKNLDQYRVQSPMFAFSLPANNVLGVAEGPGFAVSDGVFLLIPPLPAGPHEIQFGGRLTSFDFSLHITYHLTVEHIRPAKILAEYTLPPYSLEHFGYTAEELAAAEPSGLIYSDRPAIGSGLQHLQGDWYLGITDRGPNADHFPVDGDCKATSASSDGKIFTLPQFSPALVMFHAVHDRIIPVNITTLIDGDGMGITGVGNDPTDDKPFGSKCATTTLPLTPNGMDVEDFHTLPGWKFIGVEEYSPSVFIGDLQTGQILKRYTPVGKALAGASYPVSQILPGVIGSNRRNNRGFESVAVSADGRTAYVVTQSPLGSTKDPKFTDTRVLRVLRLNVSKPMQAKVTGQFVVLESPVTSYPAGTFQRDLKVSSAAWVATDKLLFLERSDQPGIGGVRLVLVDLASATDFTAIAAAQTLDLEDVNKGPAALGIKPAACTIVFEEFETQLDRLFPVYKLEGLSLRNANEVAISSDNDFGIGATPGEQSKLWILKLPNQLPMCR